VISPDGKHLGTIRTAGARRNVEFGDADRKTLYIAARTSIYQDPGQRARNSVTECRDMNAVMTTVLPTIPPFNQADAPWTVVITGIHVTAFCHGIPGTLTRIL